jgi:hypothetical protein
VEGEAGAPADADDAADAADAEDSVAGVDDAVTFRTPLSAPAETPQPVATIPITVTTAAVRRRID